MPPTAAEIRRQFIEYFAEKHGHTFAPSSPVVPHDDPTLLFTNAGMNQFKDVFLGAGSRDYTRAVNSQKCIRAGGKHNDLDDVGKDSYHHTFFEMLGNWSFGDYFKAEAIEYAWDLLTNVWGLEKDRLYATVFGGDEEDGLPADEEAERLWAEVTDIDPNHIMRFGKKDNFWEMGDTGPCGPCTEIHYDFTPDKSGGALVNADDERVVEIWNLVFIQFNRADNGKLSALPAKHVDTGMGFERVARVLQGKSSNYDIDLWAPIFMAIEQRSGARGYGGKLDDPIDIAYRVIADHIRCLTFAITDGAVPGAEGRGYVLRRILRRAARYGRQTLGVKGPFLHHLVDPVIEAMGEAFPEIARNPDRIRAIVLDEEETFGRTLDRGIELFNDAADRARRSESTTIAGEDAFKLHDTYGFPIDLTELMAEERGMRVDLDEYERLMEEARDRARAAGAKGKAGAEIKLTGDEIARLKHLGIEPTRDIDKFHGRTMSARIKAIWNGTDFDEHTHAPGTPSLEAIITNHTNFYAEMGGQVGDTGRIFDDRHGEFEILDTQAYGGYVLHIGRCTRGKLNVNDTVQLEVSGKRRGPIMQNHTGTHLLNLALRETLGPEVDQKGSLVAPDRFRFDFGHNAAVTSDEIERVTELVKRRIDEDLTVYADEAPLDTAKKIKGLRAVFGERYPDPVRVVSIGHPVEKLLADPGSDDWSGYSIEFCGGTHCPSTGEILEFAITSEEAVARGVRRVEALTGAAAVEAYAIATDLDARTTEVEGMPDDRLPIELAELVEQLSDSTIPLQRKSRLRERIDALHARAKALRKQEAKAGAAAAVDQARAIADRANGAVIVETIDGADADALRAAMDVIKSKRPDAALMLVSADEAEGKVAIIARVPDPLIKRGLKAGDWVREVAKVCGGGGGGRPDMAQAGGKDPSKVQDAVARAREVAEAKVG
ncbi:MAG: alanine--tRNA ligase [Phycisphaerales bacterium]